MNAFQLEVEGTPEFYRRRYFELKTQAKEANTARLPRSGSKTRPAVPDKDLLVDEIVPGGWYWTDVIARGNSLRIVNDAASPGVSVLLWNADDPSERLNPADTIKVQWTARIGHGKLLLSDMGRALASITSDTCGMHDCVAGGSTPQSNACKYGASAGFRNTRDNFLLAAAKHGLGPRDVGPCITFFAPVITDSAGRFVWQADAIKPGDSVDLRAEMNLIAALSNSPHPLSPAIDPPERPISAIVWRSPPAEEDDFCRSATEEAIRAFDNTDALFNRRAGK
jgi:uncharacterized protein